MGQDQGEVGARQLDDSQKSPEQLRAEIQETREGLGDTVEALAAKTDVKARARERADELKSAATLKKDELLSKVRRGDGSSPSGEPAVPPTNGASSTGGGIQVSRLKDIARENPVPMAALAAFIGGVAFARLVSRP